MILDERITLMCAMRYALGRKTYVVSSVTSQLIKNWGDFASDNRDIMVKEIIDAIKKNQAGMPCDVENWEKVLDNHADYLIKQSQASA